MNLVLQTMDRNRFQLDTFNIEYVKVNTIEREQNQNMKTNDNCRTNEFISFQCGIFV